MQQAHRAGALQHRAPAATRVARKSAKPDCSYPEFPSANLESHKNGRGRSYAASTRGSQPRPGASSHSCGANEQQAVIQRIFLYELLCRDQGILQGKIRLAARTILANVEIFKCALLVALRDARLRNQLLGVLCFHTLTTRHTANAVGLQGSPSCSFTLWTIDLRHLSPACDAPGHSCRH